MLFGVMRQADRKNKALSSPGLLWPTPALLSACRAYLIFRSNKFWHYTKLRSGILTDSCRETVRYACDTFKKIKILS
jgi:hypothetical protein